MKTALVWFRTDLRVRDNRALAVASEAERLRCVYCFDPREFGSREYGGKDSFRYEKTGSHRTRFLRESVEALRISLRERGNELVVRHGRPEEVVPSLAADIDADLVCFHALPTPEERAVERAVTERLADPETDVDADVESIWGHTLYHPDDVPVPVAEIDDTFTTFRQTVERSDADVRPTVDTPTTLPPVPEEVTEAGKREGEGEDGDEIDPGTIPSFADLGVEPPTRDERRVLDFEGGEPAGLERLERYVWTRDRLREYKETRNGLLGSDYSSKLSPWLNAGCLSPRTVFETVQRYERERVENESTYWLVFELLWRDFFQFQFAKHGSQPFKRRGIRRRTIDWRNGEGDGDSGHDGGDEGSGDDGDGECEFERWKRGETGIPFVDANMRELNETGYMSNRGRQNVASVLANDLRIDWRKGAAYFETKLVDYDPASNYGNWAYVAGVGNDSRNRSFDVLWQAEHYDPDAAYVKYWLPELRDVPDEKAHEPWRLTAEERDRYGVTLGEEYPEPLARWLASND
ncbi:deoxyribodipyrimidine photolyase [Haladaptatus paucihalophilus DX253]|uniref:Cryptochrome DASH n=1 Tax=Haladaptatus paucihalophilus DX253 TaxID=797209 RepID=E7QPR7_HALPU|nr:DASH family cryptochrome [Haladaptatus paucihalophilus]EFW93520.1 deoxyribodipyrimidine photolyase [Haladaptatus paucihalophilus DX253]SHL21317.1 deoxyribodipyrimidine photo-lyase (single-stranded DNA-specific) [Haladaptatus paucihalophilus DX253]